MSRSPLTIANVTVWLEVDADIRTESDPDGSTWLRLYARESVQSLAICLGDRATVAKLHGVLTRALELLDDPRAGVCRVCQMAEPDQLGGTCRACQDAVEDVSPCHPDLAPDRDEEE